MKRVKLTVAYDGTNYCGWQYQINGLTIEEILNKTLSGLLKENITVIGASRTDSGVHARGNVAVFDTENRMPADKIWAALNQRLPEDIRIQDSEEVHNSFHPRKANCKKTYEYKILARKVASPVERLYSHFCYHDLDVDKMRQAAAYLVGEHDFKSFCTIKSQAEETVRTIYSLDIDKTGEMITIRITGSGFLYNMVRIIAGTLLKVGNGAIPPEQMEEILEARDRAKAGPTGPAKGLTLVSMEYEKCREPEIAAENRHWHYSLDQRLVEKDGIARLSIYRCEDIEFPGVIRRVVHQAIRNGACQVFAVDLEKKRIVSGSRYGLYVAYEAEEGWFAFRYEPESS